MTVQITDNKILSAAEKKRFEEHYPRLLKKLENNNLQSLANEENLLIFPGNLSEIEDLDDESLVIKHTNHKIQFQNIIGFIGLGDEKLTIHSRFSKGKNDYFLDYMLEKILQINIFRLNTDLSFEDKIYELLKYMFPRYLNEALKKGIYKQYKREYHNDNNVKGTIDIARHIKMNTPFVGNIAYSTREFTGDNELMQLIRHTIEYIKGSSENGSAIVNYDDLTRQNINAVIATTPTYNAGDRLKVMINNQNKPVRHAYYTEYRSLQRLCLMILNHRKHSYGNSSNQINGILFDVAWLWEEYVGTLFNHSLIIHSRNRGKNNKQGISLFSDRVRTVYPDFYSKKLKIVFDTKYKNLEVTKKGISRADLYQMISYSYVLKNKATGVVYPSPEDRRSSSIGTLAGYGADIFKYGICIPNDVNNYQEFKAHIKKYEELFKKFSEQVSLTDQSEINPDFFINN